MVSKLVLSEVEGVEPSNPITIHRLPFTIYQEYTFLTPKTPIRPKTKGKIGENRGISGEKGGKTGGKRGKSGDKIEATCPA
jgi:hypothetical protein